MVQLLFPGIIYRRPDHMENLYIDMKIDENTRHIENAYMEMARTRNRLLKLEQAGQSSDEMLKDLEALKGKLYDYISQIKLLLMESRLSALADQTERIMNALEEFKVLSHDYTRFTVTFEKHISALRGRNCLDAQSAGRFMNQIKMGYFPTDLENVEFIKRALTFPETAINILDPCCGCGLAVRKLSEESNSLAYGVELDEKRAEEARKLLHRIGKGSFFHSRISNEAFHILFLNPPYMVTCNPDGFNVRDEKKFLVESMYCLMTGGILIYIIPYYRLTPDICRILCDNFNDIGAFRFTGREFDRFKQVAVMGIRKHKEDGSTQARILNRLALHPEDIPSLDTAACGIYTVPAREKTVELFKGAVFDVEELSEQFRNSKSISCLFQKNELDTMERRPLLPFTIGQIGLIGGSGLLNGLIECETPHILKGRIIKETRQDVKEPDNGKSRKGNVTEMTETTVNRMVFNILTPDGMKTLV